uniref:Putative LOC100205425 [Hydra vulgaris] n=1 Tax=Lepeophtheirus salmonis TaxID=72036 RepID=A0A0K2TY48_LEPSM
MIDEVYSAQRVEFGKGKFMGCEYNQATKTVLTFMIKSSGGKYIDVVALVPVSNLTAEFIYAQYEVIMKALWEVGFRVVALSENNHTANRNFYDKLLCSGELKTSIPHPQGETKKIHLTFDPVHNFKNIYNCFQRVEVLECPSTLGRSETLRPNFVHLKEIHFKESHFKVKQGHKLTLKAFNPTNLEKTNVKLADAVFHESSIGALKYYSKKDNRPEFEDTAEFSEFVRTMWNILNVKTPGFGYEKRDELRELISEKRKLGLSFLRDFVDFLVECQNSKASGLTAETFLATKQRCLTVADLEEYLLLDEDFSYVLLGMFQSVPIERRFGWYRQLSDCIYYINVRQILEAEKKICILSLVKFSGKYDIC